MIVYHEVNPSSLESVLRNGLKRTSRGEKGDDPTIAKTDKLLDQSRPEHLGRAGVSRDGNLYGYITDGDAVIDITDGKMQSIKEFIQSGGQAALRIMVDPERCYVSDLDAYDAVVHAVTHNADDEQLAELAKKYWDAVTPLKDFRIGTVRRPEVMITYDVAASKIKVLSEG